MSAMTRSTSCVVVLLSLACSSGGTTPPPPNPPAAPAGLTASAGINQVTLSWPAVAGAATYNVYYATTAGVSKGTGTAITGRRSSPYAVAGLVNGTTYHFVVTAVGPGGESAESPERSATPATALTPPAPGGLRAAPGNTEVTVSWNATPGAASYNLYWSATSGVTHLTGTKVTGAVSPQAVTGLTNGTTYYFVVTGVSPNGEGVESLETSARPSATPPPAAPTGVSATPGDKQVLVTWSAVSGATSYSIYYSTASGVSKTSGTRVAPAASSQLVTGLTNATTYYFVVTASDAAGEGVESAEVRAAPRPPGATYAQADLSGGWDVLQLTSNSAPRWGHTHIDVAADGTVTLISILQNDGPVTLPPTFDMKLAISADGTVTNSGADGSAAFHGSMTSTKTLVFATDTEGNGAHDLFVIRKRVPGVTFSASDVASVAFAYHALSAGSFPGWEYGDGATSAAGALTINHTWDQLGAVTPPAPGFATLTIDAAGVMGFAGVPGVMTGVMAADKKSLFLLNTPTPGTPPEVQLIAVVLTRTGFTASNLEGSYRAHILNSGATTGSSFWTRGDITVDPLGAATWLSYLTSGGVSTLPASFDLAIDGDGVITRTADATFRGHMAWNGDFYVRTAGAAAATSWGLGLVAK